MTDRDEFAKAAMQAVVSRPDAREMTESQISRSAYLIADAMIIAQGGKAILPEGIADQLHTAAMNAECNTLAMMDGPYLRGFREGHKAARHAIAEYISSYFSKIISDSKETHE